MVFAPWRASASAFATEYVGGSISKTKLLTRHHRLEDHYCDMDCKIAGHRKKHHRLQPTSAQGIPHGLMAETVKGPRVSACTILAEMAKTLAAPRRN